MTTYLTLFIPDAYLSSSCLCLRQLSSRPSNDIKLSHTLEPFSFVCTFKLICSQKEKKKIKRNEDHFNQVKKIVI